MATEASAPAPTEAPAVAAPETPAASLEVPREKRSAALIEKAVKAQQKLTAEQLAGEGESTGTPERGPDGKFLPTGAKPKAKTPKAQADAGPAKAHTPGEPGSTPGPATKTEPKPEEPVAAGLGKARRLVNEGKLAEAMQLIGLDPSKLESPKWAAWRHQQERAAKAINEQRQQVEAKHAQMVNDAQALYREFAPLQQGREAYAKGDYEEAFRLWTGEDLNSFQRKALGAMANPGVGKDPVIAELRKEIASLREERKAENEQKTQAQQQQELQQRRQAVWNRNAEALAESGDPRMAQLAQNQKFMRIVWAIQGQHYDETTDSTLPPLEAAELALEQLEAEHSEWSTVFGGGSPPPDENATRARTTPAATGPSGTSARRTAKAVTTLNPAEAAEAAPTVKLKGKALIDYYSRKAKLEELRNGA